MKIIKMFIALVALSSLSACSKYSSADDKLIIPPQSDYIPPQK